MLDLTPLEKMLLNAGPLREDGTDRFFGLENVCLPLNHASSNLLHPFATYRFISPTT